MPIAMAVQNPHRKTCGIRMMNPISVRNGRCHSARIVTVPIANAPRTAVVRAFSVVAEIVTGAMISKAKGLFSPPVRNSRNDSCAMSKNSIPATSFWLSRLFSGKTKTAIRFAVIDAPMARKQSPRFSCRSNMR